MSYPVIVDSYMIDSLKRKARAARLQACRASPNLEIQLRSLADRYVVLSRGEVVAHGDGATMDADNVRAFLAV